MVNLFKKVSIPLLAITLPLFPFEIFVGFVAMNIINRVTNNDANLISPISIILNR